MTSAMKKQGEERRRVKGIEDNLMISSSSFMQKAQRQEAGLMWVAVAVCPLDAARFPELSLSASQKSGVVTVIKREIEKEYLVRKPPSPQTHM